MVAVLVLALVAAVCVSDDKANPDQVGATPPTSTTPRPVQGSAPLGEPLSVRLTPGIAQTAVRPDPVEVVEGEYLSDAVVASIFDRLPEWLVPDENRLDFNRPAETLRPPLVGETIDVPFPVGIDEVPPDVPTGPLEVLRYQPDGPVDVAPFISITFDQPMVPLATVAQLDARDVPVIVTPALPGRWQWVGTRTLRFEHEPDLFDRLPMATEYRVEIPASTASQTGGTLGGAVT